MHKTSNKNQALIPQKTYNNKYLVVSKYIIKDCVKTKVFDNNWPK